MRCIIEEVQMNDRRISSKLVYLHECTIPCPITFSGSVEYVVQAVISLMYKTHNIVVTFPLELKKVF